MLNVTDEISNYLGNAVFLVLICSDAFEGMYKTCGAAIGADTSFKPLRPWLGLGCHCGLMLPQAPKDFTMLFFCMVDLLEEQLIGICPEAGKFASSTL